MSPRDCAEVGVIPHIDEIAAGVGLVIGTGYCLGTHGVLAFPRPAALEGM